jgi:hypothetical protein
LRNVSPDLVIILSKSLKTIEVTTAALAAPGLYTAWLFRNWFESKKIHISIVPGSLAGARRFPAAIQ